jgi:c-di-GMP-binding flagellar brake protein YcgR
MSAGPKREKRRFYRHAVSVPITLSETTDKKESYSKSLDVSLGGLSFLWPRKLSKGAVIGINIAVKDKLFEMRSKVAYAKEDPKTGTFRTGVCFMDYPSAFMARLVEEMLEILRYRKNLSRQLRREVTEEEAADVWIKKYAAKFPGLSQESLSSPSQRRSIPS